MAQYFAGIFKENKNLSWTDIQDLLNKPIWDDKTKKWRVIDGYQEYSKKGRHLKFTDGEQLIKYVEDRFYLDEIIINEEYLEEVSE